jgi:hypothetical protein
VGVDVGIAKIGICIVQLLLDAPAIRRDAKQGFTMVISASPGKRIWDLRGAELV